MNSINFVKSNPKTQHCATAFMFSFPQNKVYHNSYYPEYEMYLEIGL